jgi:hypothetical protein
MNASSSSLQYRITSYLVIVALPKSILNHHLTYLLHLVRLRHGARGLEVEDFGDPVSRDNMMAALDPLIEAQPLEKPAKLGHVPLSMRGRGPHLALFASLAESPDMIALIAIRPGNPAQGDTA